MRHGNNKRQNERIKRIVAILCALFVVLAFIASVVLPPAFAATKSDVENAQKKTEQAKKDVQNAKDKKKGAIDEYNSIEKQISDTEDDIVIIENQIEQTKQDLALKEEELQQAQNEYDEYEKIFLVRARTMYENGNVEYLEILFGSQSFSDFISKMDIVSKLVEYDRDIMVKLDESKKRIESAKAEIENILSRQEESKGMLENKRVSLENALSEKERLISSLSEDIEKFEEIYNSALKAQEEMIRKYSAATSYASNPVKYTGGQFEWPVPSSSRITSYYGTRIHPISKTKKFHSGLDIGAAYGTNIVAAADGTVTLATTNGGYGKCIIINHGSGITTLYGHNSSLLVSSGDTVKRGQVIAKAGSTGVSTGPHCHFEVRINGSTTDPLPYLK